MADMSQALPDHIEQLIDHGSTVRADEDDPIAFLFEVALSLEEREITNSQAHALLAMLGFTRDQLAAVLRHPPN